MKKFLYVVLFGAVLGGGLFAWFSPTLISWYFTPPADIALSCRPAVDWALVTYRKIIVTGVIIGTMVSSILFFAARHYISVRRAAQQAKEALSTQNNASQ